MSKRRQSSCQRKCRPCCQRPCIKRVVVCQRRRRRPLVAALATVALFFLVGC